MKARVSADEVNSVKTAIVNSIESFSCNLITFNNGIDELIRNLELEIRKHESLESECYFGIKRAQEKNHYFIEELLKLKATLANTRETISEPIVDEEGNRCGFCEKRNHEYDRLLENINNIECKNKNLTNYIVSFEDLALKINEQKNIIRSAVSVLKEQKILFNSSSLKSSSSFEIAASKLNRIISLIERYSSLRINAISNATGNIGGYTPGGFSARDKLIDYMNSNGYGPQDYARYSLDKEWQILNKNYIDSIKTGIDVVEVLAPEYIKTKKEDLIREEIYKYLRSFEKQANYKFENDDEINKVIDVFASTCGASTKMIMSQNGFEGVLPDLGKTVGEASAYAVTYLALRISNNIIQNRTLSEKIANDHTGIALLQDRINMILNSENYSPSNEDIKERDESWAAIDSIDTGDFVKNSILQSNLIMLLETSGKMVRLYNKDNLRVDTIIEESDLLNCDNNVSLDKNLKSKLERTIVSGLLKMANDKTISPIPDIERDNAIIQFFNETQKLKYGESATSIKEKSVVKEVSSKIGYIVKTAFDGINNDEVLSSISESTASVSFEANEKILKLKKSFINDYMEAAINDEIAQLNGNGDHKTNIDQIKEDYVQKYEKIYLESGIKVLSSTAKKSAQELTKLINNEYIRSIVNTIDEKIIDELSTKTQIENHLFLTDFDKKHFCEVAEKVVDLDSIDLESLEDGELKDILRWRKSR